MRKLIVTLFTVNMTILEKLAPALFLAAVLTSCATPPKPIELTKDFWERKGVLGIATATYPKATAYTTGQQGVLDLLITRSGELPGFIEKMDVATLLSAIPEDLSTKFRAQGFEVKQSFKLETSKFAKFESTPSQRFYADFDFRPVRQTEQVDRLLLITVEAIGTTRPYYGFLPTGPPKGMITWRGELIDLSTNELLWRYTEAQTVPVYDPWDEPPNYPRIVDAVTRAVDSAKRTLEFRLSP